MNKNNPQVETEYVKAFYDKLYVKYEGKAYFRSYFEYFSQLLSYLDLCICIMYWMEDGLTQRQIAEHLKCSKSSISKALSKSRKTVETYLSKAS